MMVILRLLMRLGFAALLMAGGAREVYARGVPFTAVHAVAAGIGTVGEFDMDGKKIPIPGVASPVQQSGNLTESPEPAPLLPEEVPVHSAAPTLQHEEQDALSGEPTLSPDILLERRGARRAARENHGAASAPYPARLPPSGMPHLTFLALIGIMATVTRFARHPSTQRGSLLPRA